ncbi:MAG TPA: M56 family metallopeptidase [Vicinamibacterales bacterium]|nr:M56 family metallopeptidase [Vicinamibacterales bacterium]
MNLLVMWLVGGVAVAAVATLAARLIPASAPAQRHAFWWLTLGAIVAMPWLSSLVAIAPTGPVPFVAGDNAAGGGSLLVSVPALPWWLPTVAIGTWALAACTSLLRLVVNLRAVRRLADAALPLPAEHAGRLRRVVEARAGSRAATVCVSGEIRGACAVGFVHPRVLLSADLVAVLDDRAIEAIVLHEYAHLQRYDDWTRLVQRVAVALVGLHPAVRWASRHIDIEREASCDRLVVARVGAPLAYARALASAAEISARMTGLSAIAAPGAAATGAGLHARVARLVASAPLRPRLAWVASLTGAGGLALATAGAVAMPPLVEVEERVTAPLQALISMPL